MGPESRFVHVNLVEPDPVGLGSVLNDIESQASGFIVHGALGVVQQGLDERVPVSFLNLDWLYYDVHAFSPLDGKIWYSIIESWKLVNQFLNFSVIRIALSEAQCLLGEDLMVYVFGIEGRGQGLVEGEESTQRMNRLGEGGPGDRNEMTEALRKIGRE